MDSSDLLFCNEEIVGSPCEGNSAEVVDSAGGGGGLGGFGGGAQDGDLRLLHRGDSAPLCGIARREPLHLPESGYSAALKIEEDIVAARFNALHWMMKVRNVYSFSPLTVALAVNYFDRYLSKQQLTTWKAWMIELLSVACLSLAVKMEEPDAPMLQDLQIEGLDHVFESKTIQRMEIAVLKSLCWRMGSVTPFSYIEGLVHNLDISNAAQAPLLNRVVEVVTKTLTEIEFLEFPPSVVALSAVSCALEELIPPRADALIVGLMKILPIEEDKLRRCYRKLEELVVDPLCPLLSVSQVLDNRKTSPSPLNRVEFSQSEVVVWGGSSSTVVAENSCSRSVKRKLDEFLK